MKNMAPVIAPDLLKTLNLAGDDKQHLLNPVPSSHRSVTWKGVEG